MKPADPSLRRLNLEIDEGRTAQIQRAPQIEGAGPSRSVLTNIFPTYAAFTVGFEQIAIPAGTTIAAGQSGWFGLGQLIVGENIEQDVYLDWASVEMCPTESAANGTTNAIWGTTSGTGAAIVIGANLPIVYNAWNSAACYVPGVEATTTGNLITNAISPYDAWFTFPTGEYSDTAPNKQYKPYPLGKVASRYRNGTVFGVALVVRGSQVTAGANKNLRGHVAVNVRLGRTQTTQGFQL